MKKVIAIILSILIGIISAFGIHYVYNEYTETHSDYCLYGCPNSRKITKKGK